MILAAGLGTRLLPLTEDKPKALVKVNNRTLLEICIQKLVNAGITDIIINVHHFAEMIITYLNQNNNFNVNIQISDERTALMDSGGGILRAASFFGNNDSFLVYNVDILSNIDLNLFMEYHLKGNAIATLAVRNRLTTRYLLFDKNLHLQGRIDEKNKLIQVNNGIRRENLRNLAFSGIHMINPLFFQLTTKTNKFSIIDAYLELSEKETIKAYLHDEDTWIDAGKPSSIDLAKTLF